MKKINNNFLEPSEQKLSSLIGNYHAGRFFEAEKLAISITQEFPKNNRSFPPIDDFFPGNGQESLNLNPMGRSVPY